MSAEETQPVEPEEVAPAAASPTQPAAPTGTGEPEPAPEPEPEGGRDLIEAEARAQEYLGLAQRKQAEFENFRRRMSTQASQAEERGVGRVAKELLPALDHLELALAAAEQHAESTDWVKGIRAVQDEFKTALGRVGIEAFAPLGEVFDPNTHEAMAQAPFEGREPGTVGAVYQAGYRLGQIILRPARVVVAQ